MKKNLGVEKQLLCWKDSLGLQLNLRVNYQLPTDLEMESIPMEELSSLVEHILAKTREASQNTDLDI